MMAQPRCLAVVLMLASMTGFVTSQASINWDCGNETTVAGLATCTSNLVDLRTALAMFNPTVIDPCTQAPGVSGCFVDTQDMQDCTFVEATFDVTCACPNLGVAYTQATLASGDLPGQTCDDLDECATNQDNCDSVRATCTNTVGSFTCSCNFGFVGDGLDCLPVFDECNIPVEPTCDPIATCETVDRTVGCFALTDLAGAPPTSFAGASSALECIDICFTGGFPFVGVLNNDCYCRNSMPSGTQGTCDIACGDGTAYTCGGSTTHATVYRTGAGHTCTCPSGYFGDGFNCADVNECASLTVNDGSCTDTVGSFVITCNSGFLLDSSNQCVTPLNRPCTPDGDGISLGAYERWTADCQTVGLYDCAVPNGLPTVIYAVTAFTNGACGSNGLESTVTKADFTFEDFVTNNNGFQLLRPAVVCGQDSMSISIDRFIANFNGFYLPDLGIGDIPGGGTANFPAACRGARFYADGAFYQFKLDLTSSECGFTATQDSATQISYTMKITGSVGTAGATIVRQRNMDFAATCTYTTTNTVASSTYYIYNLPSRKKRSTSEAVIELQAKQDATFSSAYDDQPIMWNQMAYIEAALQPNPEDRFSIQWLQCWESPSNLAIDQRRKYILKNGCDIDSDVSKGGVTVYKNAKSTAQLGFNPHSFGGGEAETVYVHCLIDVCDNSSKCCTDVCKDRAGDKSSFKVDPTFKMVTSGPIVVKDTCGGSSKGGCEQLCSVTEDGSALCSCVPGFEVDPENKSACRVVKEGSTLSQAAVQWYYVVLPIFALLLIAVALAVALKMRQKPSSAYKLPELADLADDS